MEWADELEQKGTSRGPKFDAAMEVARQVKLAAGGGHLCDDCSHTATWVRMTQFSGDHYFCGEHALKQPDFGKEDPSYFFWQEVAAS